MIKTPQHIAIIPDGNRRWARKRGLSTFEGHRRGFNALVKVAQAARKMGIRVVTVWGFSTENWKRSKEEVNYLMKLYEVMIDKFLTEARKEKIKIVHLGRKDRLPTGLMKKIKNVEKETKDYKKYLLAVALDYGGRDEILRAVARMINDKKYLRGGRMNSSEGKLSEEKFAQFLDTAGLPDPDLIIRTSGEQRLSGFLPWQGVYAELYFEKSHFPDFTPAKLKKAIKEYSRRKRRYGK